MLRIIASSIIICGINAAALGREPNRADENVTLVRQWLEVLVRDIPDLRLEYKSITERSPMEVEIDDLKLTAEPHSPQPDVLTVKKAKIEMSAMFGAREHKIRSIDLDGVEWHLSPQRTNAPPKMSTTRPIARVAIRATQFQRSSHLADDWYTLPLALRTPGDFLDLKSLEIHDARLLAANSPADAEATVNLRLWRTEPQIFVLNFDCDFPLNSIVLTGSLDVQRWQLQLVGVYFAGMVPIPVSFDSAATQPATRPATTQSKTR